MAINGVNNAGLAPVNQTQAANQARRANFKPDLEKAENIRAEQRQWIAGQQQIMKQINSQIIGLTLSNTQPGNTQNFNNLYNLANKAGIRGVEGMQDYFSMFVRCGLLRRVA
jgi:hypothetical protein